MEEVVDEVVDGKVSVAVSSDLRIAVERSSVCQGTIIGIGRVRLGEMGVSWVELRFATRRFENNKSPLVFVGDFESRQST